MATMAESLAFKRSCNELPLIATAASFFFSCNYLRKALQPSPFGNCKEDRLCLIEKIMTVCRLTAKYSSIYYNTKIQSIQNAKIFFNSYF